MKKLVVVMFALVALLFVGCTTVAPLTATSNPLGSKVGEATGTYLFGIPLSFNIDLGVQKAAQNGGISKISTVDVKVKNLVVITKVTTVVTGE